MCAKKFELVLMGCQAEGRGCGDPWNEDPHVAKGICQPFYLKSAMMRKCTICERLKIPMLNDRFSFISSTMVNTTEYGRNPNRARQQLPTSIVTVKRWPTITKYC
jgi:hypothetical protein